MAVRQYIGARYVIKIYENSADLSSAEWESSVNYEPLTMVTYNYGSYLSKKEVPASVGNPADNPTYWVQTGFYNGQIASLQSQIDDINNNKLPDVTDAIQEVSDSVGDLDDLQTTEHSSLVAAINEVLNTSSTSQRKVMFIGDSWLNGYCGSDPAHPFTDVIEDLNVFGSVYKSSTLDAPGFINGTTFETQFDALSAGIEDVTDVIIEGGVNDSPTTNYASMLSAAQALFAKIQATYPRCNMYYFPNFYFGDINRDASYFIATQDMPYITQLCNELTKLNVTCSIDPYLSIDFDVNYWIGDKLHLNATGYDVFGYNVLNVLLGRKCVLAPDKTLAGRSMTFTQTLTNSHVNPATLTANIEIETNGNVKILFDCPSRWFSLNEAKTVFKYWPRFNNLGAEGSIDKFVVPNMTTAAFPTSLTNCFSAKLFNHSSTPYISSNIADSDLPYAKHRIAFNVFEGSSHPIEYSAYIPFSSH